MTTHIEWPKRGRRAIGCELKPSYWRAAAPDQ